MRKALYILGGPNLNLLGQREPEIYGHLTLSDIENACENLCQSLGFALVFRQSNHEGDLVDWIQEAGKKAAALLINPAAYTHTSVALHDALKMLSIPIIELHLSNPAARETFRHVSLTGQLASGSIAGFGVQSYLLGIQAAKSLIDEQTD